MTMTKNNCLICDILKTQRQANDNDATQAYMHHPRGPFEANPELPIYWIRKRMVSGHEYIHTIPEDPATTTIQWMFGGNFLHCSDSRFSELNNGYPIPIHDRRE